MYISVYIGYIKTIKYLSTFYKGYIDKKDNYQQFHVFVIWPQSIYSLNQNLSKHTCIVYMK